MQISIAKITDGIFDLPQRVRVASFFGKSRRLLLL
jgi:hypothetical protein